MCVGQASLYNYFVGRKGSSEVLIKGLVGWAVFAELISLIAHVSFPFALVILVGAIFGGIFLFIALSLVWDGIKDRRPCQHGVRSGSRGRCQICTEEADRAKKEREAESEKAAQQQAFKKAARRLREQEIVRLSKAWLCKTEAYFEMAPQQFENAIARLFRDLGYEVTQTPFSNDGGKDAIAKKDGKKYLIECKRYGPTTSIGRRDLQIFVAAMLDEKADGGFYINTGVFASTAAQYAARNRISLYDRTQLPLLIHQAYPALTSSLEAEVMCLECGEISSMTVRDLPSSGICKNGHSLTSNIVKSDLLSSTESPICSRCGSQMRVVNGRHGRFWGCTQYPACKTSRRL
jgi:restriction system protein